MGRDSAILWTDHTFNPWWGCTKAPGDPQCFQCYAEKWARRCGYGWGPKTERRMFGDNHWNEPRVWNEKAKQAGIRYKVFSGSMCDVFESLAHQKPQMDIARAKLWSLCEECEHIDWQLLTKRPKNVASMVPDRWLKGGWPRNVWLGTSAGTQPILDERGRALMRIPAPILFVSIEPMLGRLEIRNGRANRWSMPTAEDAQGRGIEYTDPGEQYIPFDWVIVGGESGAKARPFWVPFAEDIMDQCAGAGRPVFVKQMGSCCVVPDDGAAKGFVEHGAKIEIYEGDVPGVSKWKTKLRLRLGHHAGAKSVEWPDSLRVQQFPKSRAA